MMKKNPIPMTCRALGIALGLTAVLSPAQESRQLDELVITATGQEQEQANAPASIATIGRERLEQGQYSDITDVLEDVPGVVLTGGGAGDNGKDFSLRGMPPQYTVLLVDGKRVSSRESRPNGSSGFEQDWVPPLGAIERIEVVRGPMSTRYGSDAIGGVINIITRKVPETWSGGVEFSTTLQEDQDSGNVFQTRFHLGGPLVADRAGLQLWGRNYQREEDRIINGYEEKNLQSIGGRLSLTPNDNHDITLESGFTDQRRRSNVGVSRDPDGCRGPCEDLDRKHRRRYYSLAHTGRWARGTLDSHVQRERTTNLGRDMEITNTHAKSSLMLVLGAHDLTLGADFERQALEDNTSNQISDRTEVEKDKWAFFLEDQWHLAEAFTLTSGVRMDDDENFGSQYSPRLYGVWQAASNWTLKGGVSTGFRAPDLRETTPDWGQISRGGNVYGNPDLEPETSLSKEVAVHYQGDNGVSGSVTLFHNDFEDKITRVTCPESICDAGPNQFGADPTYRINIDEAVTQGAEVAASVPLATGLSGSLSYTYTDSEQRSGEYKGQPLTRLPRHLANARIDWQASQRLDTWIKGRFRGNERRATRGPSRSGTVAPSYATVATGLGYDLTQTATLKAGVYNLFDRDVTYDEYGFIEDGRRYWLAMDVRF